MTTYQNGTHVCTCAALDAVHGATWRYTVDIATALYVATGVILFWRTVWLVADKIIYPERPYASALVCGILALLILVPTGAVWRDW